MSGVYIKGMEMPESCVNCPIAFFDGEYTILHCPLTAEEFSKNSFIYKRSDDCPLIPVPPHGRLIDADALIAWFEEWYDPSADLEICHVIDILDDNGVTPTILEAEEGET